MAQNYTSEVLFAGTNIGGAKFETDVSEFRFGDPRGYFSTTEDLETAYDTDDESSSNAIASGLPTPYVRLIGRKALVFNERLPTVCKVRKILADSG